MFNTPLRRVGRQRLGPRPVSSRQGPARPRPGRHRRRRRHRRAPSPITSPTWAGRTSCCSSATGSPRARRGTPPGLITSVGMAAETSTEMRKYTRDLYARLEAETGQATGFKPVGLHRGRDRRATGSRSTGASRRSTATAASTCTRSRRARSKELFPLAEDRRHPRRLLRRGRRPRGPGRRRRWRSPRARACRARGSSRACPSPASTTQRGAVTGVAPTQRRHRGRVRRQLRRHVGAPARRAGRRRHPAPGGRALLPDHRADPGRRPRPAGARGPGRYGYFREEVGGLMVGLFEPVCAPWNVGGVPRRLLVRRDRRPTGTAWGRTSRRRWRACRSLDRGRRAEVLLRPRELHARPLRRSSARRPELEELLRRGRAQLDRHPHRRRPRAGARALDRRRAAPTSTSPAMNIDRAARQPGEPASTAARERSSRSAWCTTCHYPTRSMQTARGARAVAVLTIGSRRAARTSATSAAGRAPTGTPAGPEADRRRCLGAGSDWFDILGGRAPGGARGRDRAWTCRSWRSSSCRAATRARCSTGSRRTDVDGEAGRLVYTQWLERGRHPGRPHRHQARRREVLGRRVATAHRHVETDDARAKTRAGEDVFVTDVTSGYAQINVQGPRRACCQSLTDADLSNEAFPFRAARRSTSASRACCAPHHVPRRARLRAVHPDRAGDARLRPTARRGRGSGCGPRG